MSKNKALRFTHLENGKYVSKTVQIKEEGGELEIVKEIRENGTCQGHKIFGVMNDFRVTESRPDKDKSQEKYSDIPNAKFVPLDIEAIEEAKKEAEQKAKEEKDYENLKSRIKAEYKEELTAEIKAELNIQ